MVRSDQNLPETEGGAIGFSDRLLAEAVRAIERDGAAAISEPSAEARALEVDGDFEHRVIVRARSLSIVGELRQALRRSRQVLIWIVVIGLVLAAAAGGGAARAALADQPVNVFWALGGLLGIQTLLLLAWIVMMVKSPAGLAGVSLGGVAMTLGRRLAGRWHKGAVNAAAIDATAGVVGRGPIGRWMFGSISHGLWLAFNAACLLLVVLMLSAKHYRFVWETTILSADTYTGLTETLAWVPGRLGFPTPSPQQIAASDGALPPDTTKETRHAWSGLLVGSLVIYGMAPRFLLLGLCLYRLGRAKNRWRLDTTRPGYLRLQSRLMPQSARLGVVDDRPDGPGAEAVDAPERSPLRAQRPVGPPAVLALEMEPPASAWPPPIKGTSWCDLGFVDDGNDRRRVLEQLTAASTEPSVLVVVCSLTTTPDRGHRGFLDALQREIGSPLGLVLSGGESLRRRGDAESVRSRVNDWRILADAAGLPSQRVIELDLDHCTDVSLTKLEALLGAGAAGPQAGRRIESAFDLIVEHVGRWPPIAEVKHQALLHRAIGTLYRQDHSSWRMFLRAPVGLKGDLMAPLRAGADRVVGLLPDRLRSSPRWLASGALAGAFGCITAATLVSPAAIAALPMWSALGAAVAAVMKAFRPSGAAKSDDDSPPTEHRGDAIRAATLFALLLELQGKDEAAITRILEQAVDAADVIDAGSADSPRAWLDGIRHRLDVTLAQEAGR
ncbi:MAG: DUF2868 domain-containing protein [Planctomycetota bacterium]|nr:DUF2868 domain-containing protein [Planctomycetota bacterium]MCZ6734689.1 DUF2868 domain-containing protein [Planctomycetota bacterium]